ncbi:arylesterase [Thiolapillus sp.]
MRISIFLLLLSFCATSAAGGQGRTIMVFGDSLSAGYGIDRASGWVKLLQHKLDAEEQPYKVINASISGDTTRGGLERLPKALQQWSPAIVLIELGGNDGLRGLSLESMTGNLDKMIQLSKKAGARVLLLGIKLPANYGPAYGERFYRIYPSLAQKHHIPLVPFLLESVADRKTLMQADGIHPLASAQPIVMENVYRYLQPLL